MGTYIVGARGDEGMLARCGNVLRLGVELVADSEKTAVGAASAELCGSIRRRGNMCLSVGDGEVGIALFRHRASGLCEITFLGETTLLEEAWESLDSSNAQEKDDRRQHLGAVERYRNRYEGR